MVQGDFLEETPSSFKARKSTSYVALECASSLKEIRDVRRIGYGEISREQGTSVVKRAVELIEDVYLRFQSKAILAKIRDDFVVIQNNFVFPEDLSFTANEYEVGSNREKLSFAAVNAGLRSYMADIGGLITRARDVQCFLNEKVRETRRVLLIEIEQVLEDTENQTVACWNAKVAASKAKSSKKRKRRDDIESEEDVDSDSLSNYVSSSSDEEDGIGSDKSKKNKRDKRGAIESSVKRVRRRPLTSPLLFSFLLALCNVDWTSEQFWRDMAACGNYMKGQSVSSLAGYDPSLDIACMLNRHSKISENLVVQDFAWMLSVLTIYLRVSE